jgi:uncharacterized delta-60 repeat protein
MDKLLVLTLTALIVLPCLVLANDGDLDSTFGIGGRVSSGFPAVGYTNATAIQPDGKIIVAGSTQGTAPGGSADFALVRYNSNGSLDTSFGLRGQVATDFSGRGDGVRALGIQSDGKIVAAGFANAPSADFALARYYQDGSLDPTFGIGGKITTSFSASAINALAIQADGKIVAAGIRVIVRYNSDGLLDADFGIDGKVTTDLTNSATALALQADGKIIVGGTYDQQSETRGLLARYHTDGSPDRTFGNNGKVTTDVFVPSFISGLALQSNGKIIAVGGFHAAAIARFNPDGSLDTAFGTGGRALPNFGSFWGDESLFALTIQSDGKIIAGGESEEYTETMFALARFNRDGSLDETFGIGGKVKSGFGDNGGGRRITFLGIQPNGKIVAAGYGVQHEVGSFEFTQTSELARFNTSGLQLVSDIHFDARFPIPFGDSLTATVSGSNLTDETYFDLRFRSPGSNTDEIALNWQRGTTARHNIPMDSATGTWIITGVRPHLDISDHGGEFIPVSAALAVSGE